VSDEDRLRLADVVIDTAGDLAHTHAQVDDLWENLPAILAAVRGRRRVNRLR
jgi:dephospho-CoA kinase